VCPSLSGLSKVGKEIINSTIVEEKNKDASSLRGDT
jgi:hypothetical protein